MVTANFSNGYSDTYNGNRKVAAGWMITNKVTGEVIASGHSLTLELAEKTAIQNIPKVYNLPSEWQRKRKMPIGERYAKERGYSSVSEYESAVKNANAKHAENFTIETVNI